MDVIAAYRQVGSYRAAAAMCGTTHKTVKRVVDAAEAALGGEPRSSTLRPRGHNYDPVTALVAEKVKVTHGRISAKRLLPQAKATGYEGSARNFRRLVAEQKQSWRRGQHRGRPLTPNDDGFSVSAPGLYRLAIRTRCHVGVTQCAVVGPGVVSSASACPTRKDTRP